MEWFLRQSVRSRVLLIFLIILLLFSVGIVVGYYKPLSNSAIETTLPTELLQQPKLLKDFYGDSSKKASFDQPVNALRNHNGLLIVANASGSIEAFDNNDKLLFKLDSKSPDNKLAYPYGLVINTKGNLLVSDVLKEEVYEYSTDGKFLGVFIKKYNTLGLKRPGLMTIDEGKIYISDLIGNQVIIVDENGQLLGKLGKNKGELGLKSPQGIGVDNQHRIWVADAGHKRLVAFDMQGNEILNISEAGNFEALRGVAIDSLQRVFISDAISNNIKIYDLSGKELFNLSNISGKQPFSNPTGIYLSDDGKIFIADRGNNRIQIWGYPQN